MSLQQEIDKCHEAERRERGLASTAADLENHDRHFMSAERFADRAWSLQQLQLDKSWNLP